jgi:predicted metal-dependent hydrolase
MSNMRARKSHSVGKSKANVKRELLKIDGRSVEIILRTNPRARRFIVKVDPATGEVSVVAPSSRSLDRALDFARKEKDWIAGRLADVPERVALELGSAVMFRGIEYAIRAGERGSSPVWIDREAARPTIRVSGRPEHATRRLLDWLKREARKRIDERVAEYAEQLGVRPKHITIRDTSSRWGSCSSARSLSFSWRLILAPPAVLDYVVAHEVSHLRELNHRPRFWRLVESIIPDMEKSQNWLSQNGALLHRYAPRPRSETERR